MAVFSELRASVQRILRDTSGHMTTAINEWINWAILDLAERADWYWWHREGYFATVANYSTGTITTTADSRVITGAATVFEYRFVGRKMMVGATSIASATVNPYRIQKYVSTTQVNLEHPFRDTAGAAQSYVVYQDEYRLRWDVDRLTKMRIPASGLTGSLLKFWDNELFEWDAAPRRTGTPLFYRMIGVTKESLYQTGTVTVTSGSATVTGSGTSFDSSLIGTTFKLDLEGRVWEVTSAPAKTTLKVHRKYTGSNAGAAKAYKLDPPGTPIIQLYPIPTAKQYVVYEYQKVPDLLYVDTDEPEVPQKFQEAIILGAVWRGLQQNPSDANALAQAEQTYLRFIEVKMKSQNEQTRERPLQFGRWDRSKYEFYGPRLPSNYPNYP